MFISYPATSLNLLISPRKFLGNSFGNFYVDKHVLCNSDTFISSFSPAFFYFMFLHYFTD